MAKRNSSPDSSKDSNSESRPESRPESWFNGVLLFSLVGILLWLALRAGSPEKPVMPGVSVPLAPVIHSDQAAPAAANEANNEATPAQNTTGGWK